MGSAQADVVTYTALSDDGSCEDSANLRPPAPLYYGGDLTVGSLPSMPELDEQAAGEVVMSAAPDRPILAEGAQLRQDRCMLVHIV